VSTPEEVLLARETVERCGRALWARRAIADSRRRSFHKQRCAAGWLTGLGSRASSLFVQACTRHGRDDVASEALGDAARLGLVHTSSAHRVILASATQRGGADATLEAYRRLRATGFLHATPEVARLVMRGLQTPPGGSPARALKAARAFLADGVRPGRRAWNSLLCAAAGAADVDTVQQAAAIMRSEDQQEAEAVSAGVPDGVAAAERRESLVTCFLHLCLAETLLLQGRTEEAAAELRTALDLAPPYMSKGETSSRALSAVMAAWAAALPPGTAVPGGAEGLAARCREAVVTCGGRLEFDADAALAKWGALVDLPEVTPAAAAATA
jgi:hypothetical protein